MNSELLDSMYKSFGDNKNIVNEILSFKLGDFYELFHGDSESQESVADSEECAK